MSMDDLVWPDLRQVPKTDCQLYHLNPHDLLFRRFPRVFAHPVVKSQFMKRSFPAECHIENFQGPGFNTSKDRDVLQVVLLRIFKYAHLYLLVFSL